MKFPDSFRIALDPDVRRIDGGTTLVGGSPLRILRLTPEGGRILDGLANGAPITPKAQRLVRRLLDTGFAHPRPQGRPHDVTVVVPVRDEPVLVRADPMIVVDDGSASPIDGALRHPHPRGPGAARNTGWRAAHTNLVAFADADSRLPEGWLTVLTKHFDDENVAAVAPRVRSTGAGWFGAYEARRSPLDLGPREGRVQPRSRIPYVPTAALVVRRDVLEEVGGFDETLSFGEDVDLVWRIVERGWTVRYDPSVRVSHPARPSFPAWLKQRFDYGSSAPVLAQRHPAAVTPLAVSGWSAAAWSLAALGWPSTGLAVAAVTTALLARKLDALERPWAEAVRLAGGGHFHAGAQLADAVRRAWWPMAVGAAVVSPRARRAAALALLPALGDPLRIVDDVAYGAGVWAGWLRRGSFAALVPDLTDWPGRRPAVSGTDGARGGDDDLGAGLQRNGH